MQPALFDTSVYISALRRGNGAALTLRRLAADAPLWLSSVVLEELYAGAGDRERRVVERLERDFDRAKRILVPNLSDWTQSGKVLARLATKYDYEQIGKEIRGLRIQLCCNPTGVQVGCMAGTRREGPN